MSFTNTQQKIMMDRARSAVLSRDYQLAARLYRGLLQNDPDNIELLKALGNLYERSGNDKDSVPIYKKIVALEPESVDALNSLGAIYRRLKRYDESIAVLEQAIIIDEYNVQIYYNLGFTYKLMGKYDDAIICFNKVVDEKGGDVLAFNHLGTIYQMEKKYEPSIQAFLRGLKIDPNHPVLHLNLAKSYENLKLYNKACAEYENALKYKPGWTEAIAAYADLLMKINRNSDAKDIVSRAVNLDPQNLEMRNKLGKVLTKQNNYKKAEAEYNHVLSKEPENVNALSGLAETYENRGKNTQAINIMEKLEKMNPEDLDVLKQYAHVLLSANNVNSASKKIKKIWDENPDDLEMLNLLGQYYIVKGDEAKALGSWKKIKDIDGSYNEHLKEAARRYSQKENYEKALEYCQQYLNENPEDSEALFNLARTYEKQNRVGEAYAAYKKLKDQDKDNEAYNIAFENAGNKLIQSGMANTMNGESNSDGQEIDDDIMPFGEEGADPEIVDTDEDEMNQILSNPFENEEELKTDYTSGFDYESLTEEAPDSENVFSKLDDEILADGIDENEGENLDGLLEDTADDFFAANPFGGSANSGSPFGEDAMKPNAPKFEEEDISDDYDSDESFTLRDGSETPEPQESPRKQDPQDFFPDTAPSAGAGGAPTMPQRSGYDNGGSANGNSIPQQPYSPGPQRASKPEAPVTKPSANKNPSADYADGVFENDDDFNSGNYGNKPSDNFAQEPVFEDETEEFGNGNSGNESFANSDEGFAEEPEFSNIGESADEEPSGFGNDSLENNSDGITEEPEFSNIDESAGEEPFGFGNDSLENNGDGITEEPEFSNIGESTGEEPFSFGNDSVENNGDGITEEPEFANIDENAGEEPFGFESESLSNENDNSESEPFFSNDADNALDNEANNIGENEFSEADEEIVSPEDIINSGNNNGFTEEPEFSNVDEGDGEEPFELGNDSLENISDGLIEEPEFNLPEDEDGNSENSVDFENADGGFTEEPEFSNVSDSDTVETVEPELSDEVSFTDPDENTDVIFDKAAETLEDFVNAINDEGISEKFSLTAQLFQELKNLSNYLSPEKKKAFEASKAHMQLEYIISRLTGRPGLLATAQAIRLKLKIEDQLVVEENGNELLTAVFTFMRRMLKDLPDQNIAKVLDSQIENILNK